MFRNPEAHQPKIFWDIDEQDALEILSLISYCHRRLDKVQKIRNVLQIRRFHGKEIRVC